MRGQPPNPWRRLGLLLVILAVVGGTALWLHHAFPPRPAGNAPPPAGTPGAGLSPTPEQVRQALMRDLQDLERRENAIAETVWAPELLAQQHGRVFEHLWDRVNHSPDRWTVLIEFELDTVKLPGPAAPEHLPHDIRIHRPAPGTDRTLAAPAWRDWLRARQQEGWQIEAIEFRHNAFDPPAARDAARSRFGFQAHLWRPAPEERLLLTGDLLVEWAVPAAVDPLPRVQTVDATGITLKLRPGPAPFREVLHASVSPPDRSFFIDPLMAQDLDGDDQVELILAAANRVYRRSPDGRFVPEPLTDAGVGLIFTAVFGDFDGDAQADLLVARFDGLFLFTGKAGGAFAEPARQVWQANPRLRYGQVLTAGDVDGDGDLDVWLGQYKGPYDNGQMPTPYYDANDGHPSWLLLNDGTGRFHEVTEERGLGPKRWRRTYSASFVDLDDDGDLDLVVISDFAGIEVHRNDGRGFFHDATAERVVERHGFGMAHTIADFNRDGRLDLLMTGMHCPAALRLDHLGLSRNDRPDYARMRPRMVSGNRLYFGHPDGRLAETAAGRPVAHAGWTWGCVAPDLDNDGWPDIYTVNGHETRQSVQDYEPHFWLHDIHVATSEDNPLLAAYFGSKFSRTRGQGMSYGGYEKNRLFLNRAGRDFEEVAWLFGLALEADSRNVIAEDVDADGRVDLVMTTFEVWPETRQTMRVFRNELPQAGNWIGFRLKQTGPADCPIGAVVTLQTADHTDRRWLVTGDSHRAQHASSVRFGLGTAGRVDRARIHYAGGLEVVLEAPAINRHHTVFAADVRGESAGAP